MLGNQQKKPFCMQIDYGYSACPYFFFKRTYFLELIRTSKHFNTIN